MCSRTPGVPREPLDDQLRVVCGCSNPRHHPGMRKMLPAVFASSSSGVDILDLVVQQSAWRSVHLYVSVGCP
jgi:hypothetical protein